MTANFEYYPDEGKTAPSAENNVSDDTEEKIAAFKKKYQARGHKILGAIY